MSRSLTGAFVIFLALGVGAAAETQGAASERASRGARVIERLCGAMRPAPAWGRYAERLSERLSLDDKQKALLKDWQEARIKARDETRAAMCSPKPDLATFAGRLDYRQKRLEIQLATFKATRPKLEAFYNALSDQQKASWDEVRARRDERRHRRRRD